MNIALLISGIRDEETQSFLSGAKAAAEDLNAFLAVYAGATLNSASHKRLKDNGASQPSAVFDYIDPSNTDVILADIAKIGEGATILNREKFLNGFGNIPLLTLSEFGDFPTVNAVKGSDAQRGYSAVCDAVSYARTKELPEPVRNRPMSVSVSENAEIMIKGEETARQLLHSDFASANPYDELLLALVPYEVTDAALFLFTEAVENSLRTPFMVPETMHAVSILSDGKSSRLKEAKSVPGISPFQAFKKEKREQGTFILTSIYIGSRQIGLLVTGYSAVLTKPPLHGFLTTILSSAVRIIAAEEQIVRLRQTITENEAEMERDDSVLERFSTEDTLTNSLNRRGFFGEAYDLLKQRFKEGTIAIVSYIDMDSIKSINDFFGREEGNKAVRKVSEILKEVFGKEALIGRVRGDEFAVLLITSEEGTGASLRSSMSEQNTKLMSTELQPYAIHLQFAVCEFSYAEGLSLKDMLAETDRNLQRMSRF